MTLVSSMMLLIQSFTILLPILAGGIVLILCIKRKWLESLNVPIDGGVKLGGKPILGVSKTWRGAISYLVLGGLVVSALHLAAANSTLVAPLFKAEPMMLALSWIGAYVAGELVNSFIKRRLGIGAGKTAKGPVSSRIQRFFDNTDGTLASGLVLIFGYQVPWSYLICTFVFGFLVHLATDRLMRRLGLKQK